MDEFQEIAEIDAGLTKLLRSVFQEQPEVAHIYLGSKRHLMERIFNDANEPFWRSAKRVELGPIEPARSSGRSSRPASATTGATSQDGVVDRVLTVTGGHPYATQELCYFLWAETPARATAARRAVRRRAGEAAALRALPPQRPVGPRHRQPATAARPRSPTSPAGRCRRSYRAAHGLRGASTTQKAIDALVHQEIVAKDGGFVRIAEPFYAEWIRPRAASL